MNELENKLFPATLVAKHVKRAIGATVLKVDSKYRTTFDGGGCDISYDFVVLWEREPHPADYAWDPDRRDRRFGTHTGCVHHQTGKEPEASVFWGSYDMVLDGEEGAEVKYAEKVRRMG